jgi:hypothetical protein
MMLSIKGLQACHICTKKHCKFLKYVVVDESITGLDNSLEDHTNILSYNITFHRRTSQQMARAQEHEKDPFSTTRTPLPFAESSLADTVHAHWNTHNN